MHFEDEDEFDVLGSLMLGANQHLVSLKRLAETKLWERFAQLSSIFVIFAASYVARANAPTSR